MFPEELFFFPWIMEGIEWALDIQIFIRTFTLVEMFEECFSWDVVIGVIRTLEHLLAFDNFLDLHEGIWYWEDKFIKVSQNIGLNTKEIT